MTPPTISWEMTRASDALGRRFNDWDTAARVSRAPLPYCGRRYGMAVVECYHRDDRPMLVSAHSGPDVAGALLLVDRPLIRMRQKIREIGFPFNPNTILNHPLIGMRDTQNATKVAMALIDGAFSTGADSLLLDHMPVAGGVVPVFQAAARNMGFPCDATRAARALHYGELAGDWPGYLATRSRNHRWQIKKAMRDVRDDPSIEVVRCDTRASIRAHLNDWFAVERQSWQGADAETAMSETDRRFHARLVEELDDDTLGDLWLVYFSGQPVAALRMLAAAGQVSVHTMHFDAAFKARAPGAIAFNAMMQAACDAGLDEVDMHGTTAFFARWATGQREHQTLRIYRKGLRGIVLQKMRAAAQALQQRRTTTN